MEKLEAIIKDIIVESLILPVGPESITENTRLFGDGGDSLDLDSLASLEILAGLAERFDMPFDDVEPKDFENITTLASYVRASGVRDADL